MKKIYTTRTYKDYHKRHIRNKNKQAKTRKYKVYDPMKHNLRETFEEKNIEKSINYTPLAFPKNFSIIHNTDEVLKFFDDFLKMIDENIAVDLQMQDVITITPDAILYLLSIFKEIRASGKKYRYKGNAPDKEVCKNLFVASGFYKYFTNSGKKKTADTRIFTIREGDNCSSSTAKGVVKYVRKYLGMGDKPTKATKDVYAIIIESMTNTFNHASRKGTLPSKWYLMAYHHGDEVHFTFLDSGLGIPKTLQTNFKDTIRMLTSLNLTKDHQLIYAALEGQFRTSTKERKRGKGLPKIMRISGSQSIKESIIISNLGYVNCSNGTNKPLSTRFHGSLLSWKIIKGDK